MSDELTFEDPPSAERGGAAKGKWGRLLAPLRGRPGEWARLPGEYHATLQQEIQKGSRNGIEPGEFEATARKADNPGRFHVWVRYIGDLPDTQSEAS